MTVTATTYEIHSLAHLLPEMRETEFAELREDIAANGLHEAITLYEGQVLDGRHRYPEVEAKEVARKVHARHPDSDDLMADAKAMGEAIGCSAHKGMALVIRRDYNYQRKQPLEEW